VLVLSLVFYDAEVLVMLMCSYLVSQSHGASH